MSNVGDLIFKICLDSKKVGEIWNKPIGLLWIDGDHSYEGVKNDIYSFRHSLDKDSIIAFHHCNLPTVKRVLSECIEEGFLTEINQVDLIKFLKLNPNYINK